MAESMNFNGKGQHVTGVNGAEGVNNGATNGEMRSDALLQIKNLKMHFPVRRGLFQRVVGHVKAVDGVNFFIRPGETLGLVGESGCGKTTSGRCIIRAYNPTDGQILYRDEQGRSIDLAALSQRELKPYH